MLNVPSFQKIYTNYLMKIITYVDWQEGGAFKERVERMHREITPPALDDNWHSFDQMAYSKTNFLNNLYEPVIRPNVFPPQVFFFFSTPNFFIYPPFPTLSPPSPPSSPPPPPPPPHPPPSHTAHFNRTRALCFYVSL